MLSGVILPLNTINKEHKRPLANRVVKKTMEV